MADKVNAGELLPLGTRVVRGPDWRWDDQDRYGPGTVISHSDKRGKKMVVIGQVKPNKAWSKCTFVCGAWLVPYMTGFSKSIFHSLWSFMIMHCLKSEYSCLSGGRTLQICLVYICRRTVTYAKSIFGLEKKQHKNRQL